MTNLKRFDMRPEPNEYTWEEIRELGLDPAEQDMAPDDGPAAEILQFERKLATRKK